MSPIFAAQTNLSWLDLSFNKITKIENLSTLDKLVDLSLFNKTCFLNKGEIRFQAAN